MTTESRLRPNVNRMDSKKVVVPDICPEGDIPPMHLFSRH